MNGTDFWSTLRYGLAVLMVMTVPPAFLWWLIVHPLAPRLRRVGLRRTFAVLILIFLLSCYGLYLVRRPLVGTDLGWRPLVFAIGVVVYATSIRVELRTRRHLQFRILAGVPELSSDPGRLLTEGIYSEMRHPRYLAVLLGLLAYALMINYSGLYVLFAVSIVGVAVIISLEEKELSDRFGEEYLRYKARVPAIFPRNADFLREPPGSTEVDG